MNKKTLTKLEYHKIIDILIEQATSFGGKERCKRLKPMTSITDIEAAQEQTAAAFTRIIKKGRPSFGSCNPWKWQSVSSKTAGQNCSKIIRFRCIMVRLWMMQKTVWMLSSSRSSH